MPGLRATLHEFAGHRLHSGSRTGPLVTNRKQAIAIALSEQRKARGQVGHYVGKPKRKE